MAAALTRHRPASPPKEGPQPVHLARDLRQLADLIELCFGARLDAGGRSAVREMKAVATLGPLLWLLAPLDALGIGFGLGYVWRDEGRVIGNASLYRGGNHPRLGMGWLIANVAVHPAHRRQGIARALMQDTLNLAERRGARWVALQVEDDNEPAIALYESLGFERFETLAHWETSRLAYSLPAADTIHWPVHARAAGEATEEVNLVFDRARKGAMTWTRPIEKSDVTDPLGLLGAMLGDGLKNHWVLSAPNEPARMLGALWEERRSWNRTRLTLFLDPALTNRTGRQALVLYVLNSLLPFNQSFQMETTADDGAIEEIALAAGFHRTRRLIQMRKMM